MHNLLNICFLSFFKTKYFTQFTFKVFSFFRNCHIYLLFHEMLSRAGTIFILLCSYVFVIQLSQTERQKKSYIQTSLQKLGVPKKSVDQLFQFIEIDGQFGMFCQLLKLQSVIE